MSQRVTVAQALELAIEHHNAGRLVEAEEIYTQILAALPNQHDALHLLGLIAHEQENYEKAAELIERAVTFAPEVGEMHGNLALALQDLGRLDEAMARFQTALALNPDFAEGHSNLGHLLLTRGDLETALAHFEQAVSLAPDFVEARNNLADALLEAGQPNIAIPHYRHVLTIKSDLATVHSNLGTALLESGQTEDALASLRKAVQLEPNTDTHWIALAAGIERLCITSIDDAFRTELLTILEHPAVDPQRVVPAILPVLHAILQENGQFLTDTLLQRALALSPFRDFDVEATLTAHRRALLNMPPNILPFACALAQHCFLNEYIFAVTKEEERAIAKLASDPAPSPEVLAILASYRPLYNIAGAEHFLDRDWPAPLTAVLQQQIVEPQEERRLRTCIPTLTPINSDVSKAVRDQYEANPYPRWAKFAKRHTPASIGEVLRSAPLRFDLEGYHSPNAPEVLIAGCGTGQQSLLAATRYESARILAIDLSLSSLAYAIRKSHEANIENIEYAQADLLMLGHLERRFDLIECVGVLHHLGDPVSGWRVLSTLLRPGGVMKIGLYSQLARQDVISGRAIITKHAIEPTLDGIHRARELIAEDPATEILKTRHSFYSASELRDLIFHVQEHRFTLPQIAQTLEALDLQFLGFEMHDQQTVHDLRNEQGDRLTDLSAWHAFETTNPDTFRGMYQFWVRKL